MSEPNLLVEASTRLFSDLTNENARRRDDENGLDAEDWDLLRTTGLTQLLAPESLGGGGAGMPEALAVIKLAGSFGLSQPLVENALLAAWLCARFELDVDDEPVSVAFLHGSDQVEYSNGKLTTNLTNVPYGASARWIYLVSRGDNPWIAKISGVACRYSRGKSLGGEPRDSAIVEDVRPSLFFRTPDLEIQNTLFAMGALANAAKMAGELESISRLTNSYARSRVQFSRPIAAFQAVQQHLVTIAQESALVSMAVEVAGGTALGTPGWTLQSAMAKTLANSASFTATRSAHQVHGAMGMTQEYPLHCFTTRLWAGRQDYGTTPYWASFIAGTLAEGPSENLYRLISNDLTYYGPDTPLHSN